MAKLYYKYGAMNSGKTFDILRTAYNYEENGYKVLVIKPSVDKKGNDEIVSRNGMKRKVDFLITPDMLVSSVLSNDIDVLLCDESQFFTREQINDLYLISKVNNVIVFCYGLRADFRTEGFDGSIRLFELADKIEELATLCSCGSKANHNLRFVNGIPVFSGEQISIDGFDEVTYLPKCGKCYIDLYNEELKKNKVNFRKIF